MTTTTDSNGARVLRGAFALVALAGFAAACGSETTDFNSGGGGSQGAASGSGGAGSGTGGSSSGSNQGGSSAGGTDQGGTGGSSTGGASSGTSGATSTGGTSGASSTGGASGTGQTGGDAGAAAVSGDGGMPATGGNAGATTGGKGGAGGAPTSCNPNSDAMDMCGRLGSSCLCCPIGGPAQACICTTQCMTTADCKDPALPVCNIDTMFTERGICAPEGFICRWGARCAAPDTPIATPLGERPISELRVGDAVYSVEGAAVVVVPIRAVRRTPVTSAHTVSRVTLASGVVLEISAGHPTADGRTFGDLHAAEALGGVRIESVAPRSPYAHPFTYDILPDSSSGTYFAGGALIGSTLADD